MHADCLGRKKSASLRISESSLALCVDLIVTTQTQWIEAEKAEKHSVYAWALVLLEFDYSFQLHKFSCPFRKKT